MNSNQSPLIFSTTPHPLAPLICQKLQGQNADAEFHTFPDGESLVKVNTHVEDRNCIVVADLAQPNEAYLPLVFLLQTLKEFGAKQVGIVVPYLPYMRQDKRFHAGEAITSKIFAKELSGNIDWLVTVDPHLHRYETLSEIYSVPNEVVSGANCIARWLIDQPKSLLLGPDLESEQWVSNIALQSNQDYCIASKVRSGDFDVTIQLPEFKPADYEQVVLIDDVISSGMTVLKTCNALKTRGVSKMQVVATHGLFGKANCLKDIQEMVSSVVTCNTIVHDSNALDCSDEVITAINLLID